MTHTELRHWQDNTGVELDAFEVTALASMSRAYVAGLYDARKPSAPWPAKRELTRDEVIAKARRIRKQAENKRGKKA